MTRALLILAQLAILAFPAGVCTCARTDRAESKQPTACRSCCGHSCHECVTDSTPIPTRNQPCPEPTCPANPSFVKLDTGLPMEPAPAMPPMTVIGIVEKPSSQTQFAGQRQNDALLLPTAYLFLVYGALLI